MRKHNAFLIVLLLFIVPIYTHAQESSEKKRIIPKIKLNNSDGTIQFSGALRFNYNYSDWNENSRKEGGEFGYDVFWIEAAGNYKKLTFDAQYRFYAENSGGAMLRQGWIGYQFDNNNEVQLGQNTVPFGMLPYNSNNWFFNITYYVGLEDNSDMGIKYIHKNDGWEINAAFYKNSDMLDFHSDSGITGRQRYAYDVGGRNKEINKGNLRIVKHLDHENFKNEIGLSGQYGGLYNLDTKETGDHYAAGIHYAMDYKNWNFKAEIITYKKSPRNASLIDDHAGGTTPNPEKGGGYVDMGAYGALYHVANHADIYTAAIAYTIPVNKGALDNISLHGDFGLINKRRKDMPDSYQIVPGILLETGPLFTYIDYATGKNHPWLGPEWTDALAAGNNKWGSRLNINFGYYF